jgi:serine/threonine protein kinase
MLKNSDAFDEFTNESNVLRNLANKNIVHYYGTYISKEGNRYLVTEFLSLGSVLQLFKREDSFTMKDLLYM